MKELNALLLHTYLLLQIRYHNYGNYELQKMCYVMVCVNSFVEDSQIIMLIIQTYSQVCILYTVQCCNSISIYIFFNFHIYSHQHVHRNYNIISFKYIEDQCHGPSCTMRKHLNAFYISHTYNRPCFHLVFETGVRRAQSLSLGCLYTPPHYLITHMLFAPRRDSPFRSTACVQDRLNVIFLSHVSCVLQWRIQKFGSGLTNYKNC